jgi:hypothetical protein
MMKAPTKSMLGSSRTLMKAALLFLLIIIGGLSPKIYALAAGAGNRLNVQQ